jgi:hypothetical protein
VFLLYWEGEGFPGYVAVAIGNFADPNLPEPTIAVWDESLEEQPLPGASGAPSAP